MTNEIIGKMFKIIIDLQTKLKRAEIDRAYYLNQHNLVDEFFFYNEDKLFNMTSKKKCSIQHQFIEWLKEKKNIDYYAIQKEHADTIFKTVGRIDAKWFEEY